MKPVLVLFAKIPQPGRVKTRLSPPLTLLQTSQVAKFLLQTSLVNACLYWPGQVKLALWPHSRHQIIEDLKTQHQFEVVLQGSGDLGDKMLRCLAGHINNNQPVAIMGCDVPQCDPSIYQQAYNALDQGHNVIGPSLDGGYYIIGTQTYHHGMFEGLQWGSLNAYQQTLTRCAQHGIQFDHILPKLRDLDNYEDLVELVSECNGLEQFLAK